MGACEKKSFWVFFFCSLCVCLGWRLLRCVSVSTFSPFFFLFFFFFFSAFSPSQAPTVHVLYMNSSRNIWPVLREQCIHALFTNPQISFFINFFIKNGFHGTIDTFKNYFATVFSVFSFQFQQNKFYSNTPYDEQILHGEFKRQTPII